MAKKKKKAKKSKKPKLKRFVYVVDHVSTHFHYIEAHSKEEAQELWDNGDWVDVSYDFDECGEDDELREIEEVE
jgi:hypothetical protein